MWQKHKTIKFCDITLFEVFQNVELILEATINSSAKMGHVTKALLPVFIKAAQSDEGATFLRPKSLLTEHHQ